MKNHHSNPVVLVPDIIYNTLFSLWGSHFSQKLTQWNLYYYPQELRFLTPNLKYYHQPQLSPPHLITSAETTHPQTHRIIRLEHWCIFNILVSCIQKKRLKRFFDNKERTLFCEHEVLNKLFKKKPGNKDVESCYLTLKILMKTVVQLLSRILLFATPGLQHTRLSFPSLSPRVCPDSCPLNQWCYLTISSSATPCPVAFSLFQHQGLFQWVVPSHQVAKVLELQHQSFQWKFRVDFL